MAYTPDKSTWLNPDIEYLFDDEIIEYDIRDAGFNLIQQFKLLPPEKIQELTKLGKGIERHIAIGKLQREDRDLSKSLSDHFTEVRKIFMEFNKLSDDNIISVKKDAIYTIGQCNKLKFGQVEFIPKNTYTSYIRFPNINNLELYYSSQTIDVKGMSDSAVNRHRLYMLQFLREIISQTESHDPKAKRTIMRFIDEYKSLQMDEAYYVEFNNVSKNVNPIYNYAKILIPLTQIILKEIR